jgi:hypothetical protein
VTTSHPGQDFTGRAGFLFSQKSQATDPETASEVDDLGMDDEGGRGNLKVDELDDDSGKEGLGSEAPEVRHGT